MVAVANVHNTRILRFLLVLIVVILTIFIYASYSTTSTLTPTPTHMRMSAQQQSPASMQLIGSHQHLLSVLHATANHSSDFSPSTGDEPIVGKLAKTEAHRKPAAQHRLPTIDEDALLDGGGAGASAVNVESAGVAAGFETDDLLDEQQQYMQNFDNLLGNINSSNNNDTLAGKQAATDSLAQQQQTQQQQQQMQPQQQQPSEAEILIPTSNLQKFIENADKVLKNMTTNSSISSLAVAPSAGNEQHTDKNVQLNEPLILLDSNNLLDAGGEDNVVPKADSSAVMRVKQTAAMPEPPPPAISVKPKLPPMLVVPHPSAPRSTPDPLKGIATEKLYESGHMDEEIDAERICPHHGTFTKLLILVTSAQSHAEARMSIRQTWGHYGTRRDVSMAFILGRTTNETMNKMLTQENYIYGDLIRGSFIDSYNNLTLKTLSSLEWIDLHCSYAKYILKTDDDMFINVVKLLSFLDRHKEKRVIYGRLAKKWKPIRNKKSKYYISPDQFAASVFPAFTTGPAYVLTGDIVHELYVRSLNTVYLKLEDVFTTGIVAQKLGIKRVHVNEFLNRRISFNPCNIRNAISVHMIKSNEQFDLWKKLLDQTTKCK